MVPERDRTTKQVSRKCAVRLHSIRCLLCQCRATWAQVYRGSWEWIHNVTRDTVCDPTSRVRRSKEAKPAKAYPKTTGSNPAWRSTRIAGWARARRFAPCKRHGKPGIRWILQTSHTSMLVSSVSQVSAARLSRLSTQKAPTMVSSIARSTDQKFDPVCSEEASDGNWQSSRSLGGAKARLSTSTFALDSKAIASSSKAFAGAGVCGNEILFITESEPTQTEIFVTQLLPGLDASWPDRAQVPAVHRYFADRMHQPFNARAVQGLALVLLRSHQLAQGAYGLSRVAQPCR